MLMPFKTLTRNQKNAPIDVYEKGVEALFDCRHVKQTLGIYSKMR